MDDTSQQLPQKANKGYCYFDVNTGKWWVDIGGNGTTNAVSSIDHDSGYNRMPLNAYKADISILAYAAEKFTYQTQSAGGGVINQEQSIVNNLANNIAFNLTDDKILELRTIKGDMLSSVSFGALAKVNAVSGTYTPAGSISQGTVTITPTTDSASKLSTAGSTPTLSTSVANETLSFSFGAGAMPTFTNVTVWTGYTAATVGTQTFSGTPATITLSPVTGGAQNGDNVHF